MVLSLGNARFVFPFIYLIVFSPLKQITNTSASSLIHYIRHNSAAPSGLFWQGKRIKTQEHYECRRHDTPAKPRVKRGQSPIWNPGKTQTKAEWAPQERHSQWAFVLRLGSAAPLGLNECISTINPGLAPWAMQEYRPYRAPLRLSYHFIILILLPCLKENTPSMLVNK